MNRKLIGAKYYRLDGSIPAKPEILSTIDVIGHGTHTASTAAGKPVRHANFYGIANGTARGAVPGARLAAYKVCWDDAGCHDADILAAFDDAISDGVDVISVSIGGPPSPYFSDAIAIGAFHAMKKGVLAVMSAGNNGPSPATTENVAPWMFTVGASTTGRHFKTKVSLGNGDVITGTSINTFEPRKQYYPLISGLQAMNTSYDPWLQPIACDPGTLDVKKVKGRIIFCVPEYGAADSTVKDLGAAGLIGQYDYGQDTGFTFVLPAVQLDADKSYMVYSYINSTNSPRAIIHKTRVINATVARVASFSSRGPNPISRKILKPDIAAPGVDILAAYTRLSSVTGMEDDDRFVNYNIISGTSMSCPHVSGAAAYVKSFHRHWSPAAIKSALMTTAKAMYRRVNDRAEFSYGAGLLNPRRALNPGLVYDMNEVSYIQFLCKEGFNASQLKLLTSGQFTNCSAVPPAPGYDGINYPTMQAYVKNSFDPIRAVFLRTVTNVGPLKSVYRARVKAPAGLNVTVSPQMLSFAGAKQRRSFKVTVIGDHLGTKPMVSASLVWVGVRHNVRSPIAVYQFSAMGESLS
ncbi:unnamed protein product [Victoria cruziana]